MYEQHDTSVPTKHHADYRDRGNWGTTNTRNIHRVVYSFLTLIFTLAVRWLTRGLKETRNKSGMSRLSNTQQTDPEKRGLHGRIMRKPARHDTAAFQRVQKKMESCRGGNEITGSPRNLCSGRNLKSRIFSPRGNSSPAAVRGAARRMPPP